jgi:hypothetical protein
MHVDALSPSIWRFPGPWGYPFQSSNYRWIFHDINHPAFGYLDGNPHIFTQHTPNPGRLKDLTIYEGADHGVGDLIDLAPKHSSGPTDIKKRLGLSEIKGLSGYLTVCHGISWNRWPMY